MRSYRRRYLNGIFCLLCPLFAFSQYTVNKFKHLTKEDGLASSTAESIIQDKQGFMWFGTPDGLNRYDGYQFTIYRHHPKDKGSLSSNYIKQVLEDRKQRFWVVTDNGLNRFDRDRNKFVHYTRDSANANSIASNSVNCIFEDRQGEIWIGTVRGLELLGAPKNSFSHYKIQCKDCGNSNITCIYEDSTGNLWVGTEDGKVSVFDRKLKIFRLFKEFNAKFTGATGNSIISINEDANRNLWIGTLEGGLVLWQPKSKLFRTFQHREGDKSSLSSNVIKCILASRKGQIWVGTENGGLNLWEPRTSSFLHFENDPYDASSLSQKTVAAIFEDKQSNLWLGTHRGGVNLYSPKADKFETYTQGVMPGNLSYKDIKTFLEDDDGQIWIGTDGGGLNIWNRRKNRFSYFKYNPDNPHSIGSNAILHIMKDRKGNIWIGTWGGGLNLYNGDGSFTRFINDPKDKNSITSNNVWKIYEDRAGNLWIATFYGGLNLFDPKTRKFSSVINSPDKKTQFYGSDVISINEDGAGKIWIGTDDRGLNCYDPVKKQFSHFFYNKQQDSIHVTSSIKVIFSDSRGRLWIGQKGLYLYNPKQKSFSIFNSGAGLENETIQSILEDGGGNLWIGTTNGIIKFNPDTKNFTRYTDADGLQGLEFGQNASIKIRSGEMLFGGFKGFNIFHPDSIKRNISPPQVYLSDFQIFNKSIHPGDKNSPISKQISETKEIALAYNQSVFSFEFTALNYISPQKNQYAYRLKGFEKNWNYVGTQRKATYTNLDPGEYVFQVKASNNDGIWNETGSSVKLVIKPPFWMTWWFRTLMIFILLLVAYWILKFRHNLELKNIEEQKREDMHQVQLQLFTNISHEFRTPLTLIMGPLEKLLNEDPRSVFNHYYKLMYRNANRLMGLISELMDFRKVEGGALKLKVAPADLSNFLGQIAEEFSELALQKQITFNRNFPLQRLVWFDEHVVEKIILNLLNNSFKYTPDNGSITIEVLSSLKDFKQSFENELQILNEYKAADYVYIRVADNGIGISKDSIGHLFQRYYQITESHLGSGVGLAFVKSLTSLHKGEIYVYSERFKGTELIIALPMSEEDYNSAERLSENRTEGGVRLESISYHYANDYTVPEKDDFTTFRPSPVNTQHILIVDDNTELRNFLKESLKEFYIISEADSGKSGLIKAMEESPDLIISDVMMPEMNGIEFCKRIKDDIETSHIPLILLTAKDALESKIEGVGSGADFYFGKPLSIEFLMLTIKNIFGNREKIKERYLKDYRIEIKELVHSVKDKEFMEQLFLIIDQQLESPDLNVEYLCRQIGMSQNKLYKKIKDITGQNIVEFVRNLRLKKAVQIMTHEDVSINEVMYRVGILSQSYFTNIFKKEFHKTPLQFMQEMKKGISDENKTKLDSSSQTLNTSII